MAGGSLVPHTLPDGRTVMVPDYLVPKQSAALAMPQAPKPGGSDMRTADAKGMLAQASPQFKQVLDAGSAPPPVSPLAMTPVAPPEDAETRRKRVDAERAVAAAREHVGNKDPAKLKQVPKADPRRESNVIADTASDLYGKKPGGGGGAPPKADPENLKLVAAEVKQERTPGMRLLPEQEWRMGLSERPKELYELDPDAEQPTWGTADPVMREKATPLEQGAKSAGEYARSEYERQVTQEQELGITKRQMLADQSSLIDEQLKTVADRRDRIAKLQETADKRMSEAESFEPRTKSEVWESKPAMAQVMSFISVALGGYTQGLGRSGGKNMGWDMLNQILDDEVEGERYKSEQRKKLGMGAKNDLERAEAVYGDLDMAALESKNRKLANVMAMTQEQLAGRGLDATARQRGEQIYAMAQEQYLAGKQQLMDQITGKVTKEEATLKPYGEVLQKATPKPVGGGGAAPGLSGDKLRGLSSEVRSLAVKMPDGTFKFVRSPTVRADTQARLDGARDMVSTLAQLQRLRADKSNTIPWSQKRGQIEALNANLIMLAKSKNQMGTLDKGLVDFAAKQYGSPEQFNVVDNTIDGKIAENIRMIDAETRRLAERDLDNGPFELTEGGISPEELRD